VLGVTAVLVTIGICASVGMAIRIAGQLAMVVAKLDALEIYYEDAKATMGALRIVVDRIGDNHNALKLELAELEFRLRALEQGRDEKPE
jgi:hypothetical protein